MFWTLNNALGKTLLVMVVGAAVVYALRPFWEFGVTWNQCQKDMEEHQRQVDVRPPVGFVDGKTYYSQEAYDADYDQWKQEHEAWWRGAMGEVNIDGIDR
jgi:hypothetical protein